MQRRIGNDQMQTRRNSMDINTLELVFFSPTGSTKKILDAIAKGFGADQTETIDLTLPANETEVVQAGEERLVVFGVPVYEGRVGKTALDRLQRFRGNNTPAALVVLYGNRDYEDALIELADFTTEAGFMPVAAAAFVGEHSFARKDRPMANGRPDDQDIEAASAFGVQLRAKMDSLSAVTTAARVTPPGNRPYVEHDRSGMEEKAATTREDRCTLCGECAAVCPVGAIAVDENAVTTDALACILCNACVKHCPEGARVVDDPMINKIVSWVFRNFQDRSEPQVFI
jgi:ferredoxin